MPVVWLGKEIKGFFRKTFTVFGRNVQPILGVLVKDIDMPVDPVTAIFAFLSTPEGQKLIDPLVQINAEFATIIMDLIKKIHNDVQAKLSPTTVK